jgi:hypothetical protein
VPLPASTLPAPTVVALLVSTAVVPLPQLTSPSAASKATLVALLLSTAVVPLPRPTSPSAASKATALVVRDTSGAICRAACCADGRAQSTAVPFPVPTSVQLAVPVRRRRPCRFRPDDGLLGRRPCCFLRQRFLRRLSWHYSRRRPSCRSLSQRRPRLHRKRQLSSFVTLPALSAVQPPALTVVRSRLRCLSPYRLPYNLPCRSVADGRAASDSTTAF